MTKPAYTIQRPGDEHYAVTCQSCKGDFYFYANPKEIEAWQEGKLIQDALPRLSPNMRELLISGLCGSCFEKIFS